MEITGVDFITVPTQDFEQACHFYGNVLGLPESKRWGNMPGAEFETGTLTPWTRASATWPTSQTPTATR